MRRRSNVIITIGNFFYYSLDVQVDPMNLDQMAYYHNLKQQHLFHAIPVKHCSIPFDIDHAVLCYYGMTLILMMTSM